MVEFLWPRCSRSVLRIHQIQGARHEKAQDLKQIPVKLGLIVEARQRGTSRRLNLVEDAASGGGWVGWKRRNRQIGRVYTLERESNRWRGGRGGGKGGSSRWEGGTVSVGKRSEGGGRGGRRISRGSRVGRKGHDSRTNVTIYFHYDIIRNETRDSMPSPLR